MSALAFLSIPSAVLPILGFLWLVWWIDRYDREPAPLFLGVFLWGALGAVALALASSALLSIPLDRFTPADVAPSLAVTFLAPAVEEPAKAAILFLVVRSRHFDNVTDGFVYGAAAGLGFATTENLMYFLNSAAEGDAAAWIGTVVVRTLYAALMHAGATSLVGAALGLGRHRRPPLRVALLALGGAAACGMHALWNGLLALAEAGDPGFAVLDLLLFPLEFVALFGLLQLCLLAEHRAIRRELAEEAALGTLPAAHVARLASTVRRATRGWLPRQVDHHAYVRLCTTLALRRAAARQTGWADAELPALRTAIARVLAGG